MLLGNLAIKKKTVVILMITSLSVGFLTCLMFLGYDFFTFRQEQIRKLSTLGKVIASNSTAALAFDNSEDATTVLMALKAEPHILTAALYDKAGSLFSKYPPT